MDEYALHQRFLRKITLAENQQSRQEWLPVGTDWWLVTAPQKVVCDADEPNSPLC